MNNFALDHDDDDPAAERKSESRSRQGRKASFHARTHKETRKEGRKQASLLPPPPPGFPCCRVDGRRRERERDRTLLRSKFTFCIIPERTQKSDGQAPGRNAAPRYVSVPTSVQPFSDPCIFSSEMCRDYDEGGVMVSLVAHAACLPACLTVSASSVAMVSS